MQRRQQGAAFTPDAMDAYLPRVVATCEAYLQQWASQESVNLVPAVSVPSYDFLWGDTCSCCPEVSSSLDRLKSCRKRAGLRQA